MAEGKQRWQHDDESVCSPIQEYSVEELAVWTYTDYRAMRNDVRRDDTNEDESHER